MKLERIELDASYLARLVLIHGATILLINALHVFLESIVLIRIVVQQKFLQTPALISASQVGVVLLEAVVGLPFAYANESIVFLHVPCFLGALQSKVKSDYVARQATITLLIFFVENFAKLVRSRAIEVDYLVDVTFNLVLESFQAWEPVELPGDGLPRNRVDSAVRLHDGRGRYEE